MTAKCMWLKIKYAITQKLTVFLVFRFGNLKCLQTKISKRFRARNKGELCRCSIHTSRTISFFFFLSLCFFNLRRKIYISKHHMPMKLNFTHSLLNIPCSLRMLSFNFLCNFSACGENNSKLVSGRVTIVYRKPPYSYFKNKFS